MDSRFLASTYRFFLQHLRIGFATGLLMLDGFVLAFIIVDCARFKWTGRDLSAAVSLASDMLPYGILNILWVAVFLVFVAPMALGIARVLLGAQRELGPAVGIRGRVVVVSHLLITTGILVALYCCQAMVNLCGYQIVGDSGPIPAFESISVATTNSMILKLLTLGSAFGSIAIAAALEKRIAKLAGVSPPRWAEIYDTYRTQVMLADLGGGLYPIHGRHTLNFNAASIAPEISDVRLMARGAVNKLRRKAPTSSYVSEYLKQISRETRIAIGKSFVEPHDQINSQVLFSPGTSRALEIALKCLPDVSTIILSPFEHPSEMHVTNWYAHGTPISVRELEFSPADYSRPWREQHSKLVELLRGIPESPNEKVVFVLSHVCYATGLVIPTKEVIGSVSTRFPFARFIVDGSHAIGNGVVRAEECQELKVICGPNLVYVFSAHKWLLSPDPCGIMVMSSNGATVNGAYDAWADSLPISYASIRTIISVHSAITSIDSTIRHQIELRCIRLREILERHLSRKFIIIGDRTGLAATFLFSIQPRGQWNCSPETLRSKLEKASVFVTVIDNPASQAWVRISVPFFGDYQMAQRLAEVLEDLI